MDTYSSGEDLIFKTRKPYTITKQRERWTDDEHTRFLEALKLYGRAWQRIEEHIGTKTAVQIRSHAQKFFSKLEKEALVKGVPIGEALDIDIPPPRPKRKPSNPYPRKASFGVPTTSVAVKDGKLLISASSPHCNQVPDLDEGSIPERPNGVENPTNGKEGYNNLIQEAQCSSVSSVNKTSLPTPLAPRNSCSFMERESAEETNESYLTIKEKGNQKLGKFDGKQKDHTSGKTRAANIESSEQDLVPRERENFNCVLPTNEMPVGHTYPRHVPVQVIDRSSRTSTKTYFPDVSIRDTVLPPREDHIIPNPLPNPTASDASEQQNSSTRSSVYQSPPDFHPAFTPTYPNQDEYQSVSHLSSTSSSLIVSAMVQNPVSHAATSFAQFFPYANVEPSVDSRGCNQGGFSSMHMNSIPSMETLASITVAAATAWWAAHGMLPLYGPFQGVFTGIPASTNAIQSVENGHVTEKKVVGGNATTTQNVPLQVQPQEPEGSEVLRVEHSASKSSAVSTLLDTEEKEYAKLNTSPEACSDHEKLKMEIETYGPNETKGIKQVDRSSCCSNTGSEVDGDAIEKQEKGKVEQNDTEANNPASESSRRIRSASNMNDSWKEVSEGGRLAFQELFSRDKLPQSFSPPQDLMNAGNQITNIEEQKHTTEDKIGDTLLLDLNSKTWESCPGHQGKDKTVLSRTENEGEEGLLTIGIGHGKLKSRRTGFKPYKRCSMEANEKRVPNASSQGEEKGPKRIRLEGEGFRLTFNTA